MAHIITRPAGLHDVPALTRIMLDRKLDADPMTPEKHQASLAAMQKFGEQRNYEAIFWSIKRYPEYMVQVATIHETGEVVGYVKGAFRLSNSKILGRMSVDHGGLMVDREYESQGAAQLLEQDFKNWAVAEELPVCVRVAEGNNRARSFFRQQGYIYEKTLSETPKGPALDVLTLSYEALVATVNDPRPTTYGHIVDDGSYALG